MPGPIRRLCVTNEVVDVSGQRSHPYTALGISPTPSPLRPAEHQAILRPCPDTSVTQRRT